MLRSPIFEVSMKPDKPISEEGGNALLRLARETIARKLLNRGKTDDAPDKALEIRELKKNAGTFVTLMENGNLRGCIGNLTASEPIVEGVKHNAIGAAFHDHRFPPLTVEELEHITVEVSILSNPQPLMFKNATDLLDKLTPGIDGVIIRRGHASATFLPQVWEQLPDPEDFLSHLCRKAGLSGDAWKEPGMELLTYQVQYFEED